MTVLRELRARRQALSEERRDSEEPSLLEGLALMVLLMACIVLVPFVLAVI